MKVYKIKYFSPSITNCLLWAMNKSQAQKIARDIIKHPENYFDADTDEENPEISLVEIPTDKQGLVRWLNVHLNTDNG